MMFAHLVDLAALGRGDRTEGAADRLRQRSTVLAPPGRARAKPDRPVGPETLRQSGRPFHQRHGCVLTSPSTPIAVASTRSSPRCSPSIWTTRRSSADRSAAMKSASRAVGSATNLREAADFDTPRSGRCLHVTLRQPTARANRRVNTLISIKSIAQRASQCSCAAIVPGRNRDLAGVHALTRSQAAVTSASVIVPSASIPAGRQNRSKLACTFANASSTARSPANQPV